jgi:uncharacterized RDD family membrane protein YckC
MGSALLETTEDLEFAGAGEEIVSTRRLPAEAGGRTDHAATVPEPGGELRMQVAERLAAHRSRRGGAKTQAAEPVRGAAGERSARIAAAVAERYARTPSYREMLAAEAERAIQQARAAAEVAAQNALAIAEAQQRLLDAYDQHANREQELWPELAKSDAREKKAEPARAAKITQHVEIRRSSDASGVEPRPGAGANSADVSAGLTVRLWEGAEHFKPLAGRAVAGAGNGRRNERGYGEERSAAEASALDDEIAFRQAPVFEEPAGPPVALPANLIEFPRQLVAARKARPRYAEGPLRDEVEAAVGDGQLRIFEVDPAQISISADEPEMQTAQWTSIWLDGPAQSPEKGVAGAQVDEFLDAPLARDVPAAQPASLARRSTAGAIDATIVACGLLAFAGVFAWIAGRGISWDAATTMVASVRQTSGALLAQTGLQGRSIATICAVSGAFLLLVYHALFFWFSTATPGMRCVRIALCTFDDENPTRRNVRRRMAAMMVSAGSLGMGFAWAALDEQRLTWHDRMSRMYLRKY